MDTKKTPKNVRKPNMHYLSIEDVNKIIGEAKKIPRAITIWVKHGRHAGEYRSVSADLETDDLREVILYLKSQPF